MDNNLLKIEELYVNAEDKEILKGINLNINKGEVHVIMGPNGSGKTTTANAILNNPAYTKKSGKVIFDNTDITNEKTDEIARKGVFMSFQLPEEIPGISVANFLRYAKSKKIGENIILDETDSGLDVDAIKTVSKGIDMFRNKENAVLIITHNTKILHNLDVDYVHILVDGKIVKTGGAELAKEIEEEGYAKYRAEVKN